MPHHPQGLHIGSVRTAILIAGHISGGNIGARIEDTDMERSTPEFEANIMDGLKWLGLPFDEGPHHPKGTMKYRQSERIKDNAYAPHVAKLIERGHAYYSFETDDELDAERKAAEDQGIAYVYSRKSTYTNEVAKN